MTLMHDDDVHANVLIVLCECVNFENQKSACICEWTII